jgi:cobalt-zinc-cadmium efflux system protein
VGVNHHRAAHKGRHGHAAAHPVAHAAALSQGGQHQFAGHHQGDSPEPHSKAPTGGGARALVIALVLITGFSVVEFLGGIWSGSLALLADAGHMVTDAASLAFSLAAYVLAQRPASDRHSYGLARAEVIAAFVNSLALLAVVAWLVIEGVHRILSPHPVDGRAVSVIAGAGIVVNLIVAWFLSRERGNLNMRAALLHVLGDLLGSVAALIAGIVVLTTGATVADPLLSMLVGGLILRSTLGVLRESTLVLLDSVPTEVDYTRVGMALASIDGVLSVHDLHVWALVPGRHAVSAHLLISRVEAWPQILHDAREALKQVFGIDHVTLQPEWLTDGPACAISLKVEAH